MDFLLSSSQLRHILSVSTSRTKFRWVDVCAINELPRYELQKSRPTAFIVNSDPNFKPGKHWTAIYFPRFHSNISNAIPEFFDPYGLPPSTYGKEIVHFLKVNTISQYAYNSLQVQENSSTLCGLYCCYYLMNRFEGQTMEEIISDLYVIDEAALIRYFEPAMQSM